VARDKPDFHFEEGIKTVLHSYNKRGFMDSAQDAHEDYRHYEEDKT